MAMKRFPLEKYATLELNHVEFARTGNLIAQTPLGEEFTAEAPCENGMWVCADRSKGVVASIEDVNEPIGVVYTAEKEYDMYHYGLKYFGRKVAGDYPRVGLLNVGDTFTTNTFNYEFTTETTAEQWQELKDAFAEGENPLYVIPTVGEGAPTVTATEPAEGPYAQVVKLYTVPAGTPGIKYVMVRV